ncbi:hypothetical protein ACFQX6_13675 [Streptosporangium lutulentum]
MTNPLENVTEIEYDLAGRQIAAKDLTRTGAVVRTLGVGYDPASNPTSTTSGEGHITRQQFDALGRMTALIEPVSTNKSITSTFGYDATGARTRTTDGRGNTTWTSYNTLGLVESVIEPPPRPIPARPIGPGPPSTTPQATPPPACSRAGCASTAPSTLSGK